MTINPMISAILRHRWAIDPQYALNAGIVISGLLSGNGIQNINQEDSIGALKSSSLRSPVKFYDWDSAPAGSVALIRVRGEMMKDDMPCGSIGMATIGKRIQQADNDVRFAGILLQIDSPGGTVDGTETLANIVKNTKKPILAYVDGMMASAAAWVGTSADEIWASTDTDEVGSIGVLLSFADLQPAYEKLGVKFHLITATTSEEKVRRFKDLKAGEYDEYIKQVLDPLDKKFMNQVKANRPRMNDTQLSGKLFFVKDVMGSFIDRIGTLDNAVNRIIELSQSTVHTKIKISNSNMKNLTRVLGNSPEFVNGLLSLNEDQVNLIEEALQSGSTNNQSVEDLNDANKFLREENESLKKAAAGGSATAISANNNAGENTDSLKDGAVISESDDFQTGMNKIINELKS